jgi:hypothetical protein
LPDGGKEKASFACLTAVKKKGDLKKKDLFISRPARPAHLLIQRAGRAKLAFYFLPSFLASFFKVKLLEKKEAKKEGKKKKIC